MQQMVVLLLTAALTVVIGNVVTDVTTRSFQTRSQAKTREEKREAAKSTSEAQKYADKLIKQREYSGKCVGAACLAPEIAQASKSNPQYYESLKKTATKGSASANTLAILEMTKIAVGEIKPNSPEAKNAVDYCSAHGGKNCTQPDGMKEFFKEMNTGLFNAYERTSPKAQISPTIRVSPAILSTTPTLGISSTTTVKVTPLPTRVVSPTTATPAPMSRPSGQPVPASYYSQVDPAWSDEHIPGQPDQTFIDAGCGEVTVANILTHAGIPTNPVEAAFLVSKDKKGSGTAYKNNIDALKAQGFQADQYYGSLKDITKYMGPNDVVWITGKATTKYESLNHHSYIDGFSMVDGKPVFDLRDPYFGAETKCSAESDRGFACQRPGKSDLKFSVPPDTDNTGTGPVVVILSPPG